ncbi:MAG: cysteine desulfurase NifS [Victivallaceae bacterium]|nr:cysteine desulfurase NifS [Victivallaceae bacterium]
MSSTIYLDNNATTRVAPEVFEAMSPFFCERYGNPSSIHRFGGEVMHDVDVARRQVADLIGARYRDADGMATEIIFTSCGTESDNTAIRTALDAKRGRTKVVTTAVEHPAILHCLRELEREGVEVAVIGVDNRGRLDMDALKKAVDGNTALVTAMWANNETGTIFPVEEICRIAHESGALFHTDAVQAAGKVEIDVDALGIDMLSISGHKLHAPKGVGILFSRRGIPLRPLVVGGHQERSRRAGTENVASIVALGKACELAKANLTAESAQLARMRDEFEKKVVATIPAVRVNGDLEHRLPNTSSISFEEIEGESILMLLDHFGVCASSGSACTTGSLEPSHVLRAMGIPYSAAHGTIRFSISRYNTQEELDFTAEKLVGIISRLRELSPYWKGGR